MNDQEKKSTVVKYFTHKKKKKIKRRSKKIKKKKKGKTLCGRDDHEISSIVAKYFTSIHIRISDTNIEPCVYGSRDKKKNYNQ